jgi:hypothetical protein
MTALRTAVLAGLLAACFEPHTRQGGRSEARQRLGAEWAAWKYSSPEGRKEIEERLSEELELLGWQIEVLEDELEARSELHRDLDELVLDLGSRGRELGAELDSLRGVDASDWNDARDSLIHSLDDLEESLDDAWEQFGG